MIFSSIEIVNFGMYAGLGTKAVMDLSENYIHEGDIVILSPEQSEQTFSDYFNGEYMWQAADGAFGMLRDLKSENFEAMLGNFPRFALEKLNYVMKGRSLRRTAFIRRNPLIYTEISNWIHVGKTSFRMVMM